MASNLPAILIAGITFVLIIFYLIYIIISYHNKIGLFSPYVPPSPKNTIKPLGGVVPLAPQERCCRCLKYYSDRADKTTICATPCTGASTTACP